MPRKIWIPRHSAGLTLTAILLVSLLIRLEQIIEAVRTTIRSDRKAGLESPRGIGHGEPDDEAVRSNGNAQENGGEAGEKPGSNFGGC